MMVSPGPPCGWKMDLFFFFFCLLFHHRTHLWCRGSRYSIGNVSFKGDFLNIPESQLLELSGLKSGDIFDRKSIILGLENIFSSSFALLNHYIQQNCNFECWKANLNLKNINRKRFIQISDILTES